MFLHEVVFNGYVCTKLLLSLAHSSVANCGPTSTLLLMPRQHFGGSSASGPTPAVVSLIGWRSACYLQIAWTWRSCPRRRGHCPDRPRHEKPGGHGPSCRSFRTPSGPRRHLCPPCGWPRCAMVRQGWMPPGSMPSVRDNRPRAGCSARRGRRGRVIGGSDGGAGWFRPIEDVRCPDGKSRRWPGGRCGERWCLATIHLCCRF